MLTHSTDEQIASALEGKAVTWKLRLNRRRQTAQVNKVTGVSRKGDPYVEFVNDYGFHAVYLDAIVGIQSI